MSPRIVPTQPKEHPAASPMHFPQNPPGWVSHASRVVHAHGAACRTAIPRTTPVPDGAPPEFPEPILADRRSRSFARNSSTSVVARTTLDGIPDPPLRACAVMPFSQAQATVCPASMSQHRWIASGKCEERQPLPQGHLKGVRFAAGRYDAAWHVGTAPRRAASHSWRLCGLR